MPKVVAYNVITYMILRFNSKINTSVWKQNSLQKTFLLVAQAADWNPAYSCSISHIWKISLPAANITLMLKVDNQLTEETRKALLMQTGMRNSHGACLKAR